MSSLAQTAPHERHLLQFYTDEVRLADSVTRFLCAGLGTGDSLLIIATAEHQALFLRCLRERAIDVERALSDGLLTLCDAQATLERFLVDGAPDRDRFQAVIGGCLDEIARRRPGHRVRAYGEMVNLLWLADNRPSALVLEELWNELATTYSFRLLCAYHVAHPGLPDDAPELVQVCGLHDHVVDPESADADLDESFAMLGRQLLETEHARARLAALVQLATELGGTLDPAEVGRVIGEATARAAGAVRTVVYERVAGRDELRLLGGTEWGQPYIAELALLPMSSPLPVARAVRDGEPMWLRCHDELRAAFPEVLAYRLPDEDLQALAALPLRVRGVVVGALGFSFTTARAFDESERALFTVIAELCAQCLERARLFRGESEARQDEQRARRQAEAATRAKDEFLAMLGHELRNPLAPIVTALQLMKLKGDVRFTKEQLTIERQVDHLVRLVDDLLDVARITRGKVELKREPVSLCEVVAKAVEMASPLFEQRRHYFQVDVPKAGMRVEADPVRLAQVLANLLSNAAKYTDPGGVISLRAWRDGHEVVLAVKDDGRGMDAELLPRIFELFVQGERASDRIEGGLGLGLALVRSLVQLHGGTVVAMSEGRGCGSEFVVRLPALSAFEAEQAAPAQAVHSRGGRPLRILVVDDNVDAAELLAELLRTDGHEVTVAHDGPGALHAVAAARPQVAVLDIGLPVMDGYELAQRLAERFGAALHLIAVTGYGQEHDRSRAHAAGFQRHFVKPVAPSALLDHIAGLEASLGADRLRAV